MKSIISLIVVSAFAIPSVAQEASNVGELNEVSKEVNLPAVVIKK